MRPRLITAENATACNGCNGAESASMRPRLITAENEKLWTELTHVPYASMRPRLITAENAPTFGDAAAETRLQ